MSADWPVTIEGEGLVLRPLRRRDGPRWYTLRRRNAQWLRRWEATLPTADPTVPATFGGMVRSYHREGKARRAQAFVLEVDGVLVGQVTLGGIAWGSLRSAHIGYWISSDMAGHGLMPKAVALVTDHAFDSLRLHRIEINIRPENASSRRVAEKLGYREEGFRPQYLHIDGAWRDHISYVMLDSERPSGGLTAFITRNGWRDVRPGEPGAPQTLRDTGESVPRMRRQPP
jgi:[ribosomal protein S5]-alanine N-acetyltransferase